MLSAVLRLTALCTCVVLALIAGFQIEAVEMSVPYRAERSFTLDRGSSSVSKSEIIAGLDRIALETGVTLDKIAADPNDYLHGRDLYRFGSSALTPRDVRWFDPAWHGRLLSSAELGATSIDGSYALSGSRSADERLERWAGENGLLIHLSEAPAGWRIAVAAVRLSGAYSALPAALLLLTSALVTWHALRARGRALKSFAGAWGPRLLLEEQFRLLGLIILPVFIGVLAALLLVLFRSGPGYVTDYLGLLLPLAGALILGCSGLSLLISVLSAPGVRFLAERRPPIARLRPGAEALRVGTVLSAVICVPLALTGLADSGSALRDAAHWVPLREQVTVNGFRTVPGDEEDRAVGESFRAVLGEADSAGTLALGYVFPPEPDAPAHKTRGRAVLVNSQYLRLMGIGEDRLERIGPREFPAELAASLAGNLPLQLANRDAWDADTGAPFEYYRLRAGTELPIALFEGSARMSVLRDPLIVLSDHPGDTLSANLLLAATSQNSVLFGDREALGRSLEKYGLASRVASIDRAADQGLIDLQVLQRTRYFESIALGMLLAALGFGAWLAAISAVLSRAQRVVPLRVSGVRWLWIFRRRAAGEALVAALLCAGLGVFLLLLHAPAIAWWSLALPPAYGLLMVALHIRAGKAVAGRVLARKIII